MLLQKKGIKWFYFHIMLTKTNVNSKSFVRQSEIDRTVSAAPF